MNLLLQIELIFTNFNFPEQEQKHKIRKHGKRGKSNIVVINKKIEKKNIIEMSKKNKLSSDNNPKTH